MQSVWPDLANLRQFGKISKNIGNFWRAYLVWGKLWTYFGKIMYGIAQSFIVVNGQNCKHKQSIWSHWMQSVSMVHGYNRCHFSIESSTIKTVGTFWPVTIHNLTWRRIMVFFFVCLGVIKIEKVRNVRLPHRYCVGLKTGRQCKMVLKYTWAGSSVSVLKRCSLTKSRHGLGHCLRQKVRGCK